MKTKAIVFTKINTAELLSEEVRAPKANEVTVMLSYSAISRGTELANITGDANVSASTEAGQPVKFPRYGGYSAAGEVLEVGSEVSDIKVGDRVVVFWGNHQGVVTIGRDYVVKIPDGVSMEEAALSFIATFPLAAIRKCKLEIGESSLVMGLGTLGVFAVSELRASGAMPIIAADPVAERRDFARVMGADFALDPTSPDFCERVREITGGGVNVVIEVSGVGAGMIGALDCMKQFSRMALLGCTRNPDFSIDYYRKVHAPGISIIGAHTIARPKESFPGYWNEVDDIKAVLNLLSGKRLDFRNMICEVHSPEEAPEVYTRMINEKNFPVGVLFDWKKI